jgi:hypothetical protein
MAGSICIKTAPGRASAAGRLARPGPCFRVDLPIRFWIFDLFLGYYSEKLDRYIEVDKVEGISCR